MEFLPVRFYNCCPRGDRRSRATPVGAALQHMCGSTGTAHALQRTCGLQAWPTSNVLASRRVSRLPTLRGALCLWLQVFGLAISAGYWVFTKIKEKLEDPH